MTIQRTYTCDLCGFGIGGHAQPRGVGIVWRVSLKIDAVPIDKSEHHICSKCVSGLKAMFAEQNEEPL